MRILPVILSGGSGTRLWPLSRAEYPKQFQELHGAGTLLQQTALRLPPQGEILPPVVICNADQRFMIAEQLRQSDITPSLIVLEPIGRSTAPALAIPALWTDEPENTVLVAMPADGYIGDAEAFRTAIHKAARLAMSDKLMTLGVKPVTPHTGYGYIQLGSPYAEDPDGYSVAHFKEKPDAETAAAYLADGRYLWNTGIFVFRADSYLGALEKLQPRILSACRESLEQSKQDFDFLRLHKESFAKAPELSIDYAIMEEVTNAGILPVAFDWNDIGGWPSLWQLGEKDKDGNVVSGDVMMRDVKNSYIRSESRFVAALGIENAVIIETADAILVTDLKHCEDIKHVVSTLRQQKRLEECSHLRRWTSWGWYETLNADEFFNVRRIMVDAAKSFEGLTNQNQGEHWVIVSGMAKITVDGKDHQLGPNQAVHIPPGLSHTVESIGPLSLHMISVRSDEVSMQSNVAAFGRPRARKA